MPEYGYQMVIEVFRIGKQQNLLVCSLYVVDLCGCLRWIKFKAIFNRMGCAYTIYTHKVLG